MNWLKSVGLVPVLAFPWFKMVLLSVAGANATTSADRFLVIVTSGGLNQQRTGVKGSQLAPLYAGNVSYLPFCSVSFFVCIISVWCGLLDLLVVRSVKIILLITLFLFFPASSKGTCWPLFIKKNIYLFLVSYSTCPLKAAQIWFLNLYFTKIVRMKNLLENLLEFVYKYIFLRFVLKKKLFLWYFNSNTSWIIKILQILRAGESISQLPWLESYGVDYWWLGW